MRRRSAHDSADAVDRRGPRRDPRGVPPHWPPRRSRWPPPTAACWPRTSPPPTTSRRSPTARWTASRCRGTGELADRRRVARGDARSPGVLGDGRGDPDLHRRGAVPDGADGGRPGRATPTDRGRAPSRRARSARRPRPRRRARTCGRARSSCARGTRLGPAALGVAAGAGRGDAARRAAPARGDRGHRRRARRRRASRWAPGRSTTPTRSRSPPSPREAGRDGGRRRCERPTTARRPSPRSSSALSGADLVLVSGGVSVGPHDHVKPALEQLGVDERFWRVALRPGKPTWFGTRDATLVIGLPGNPVSALVTFVLFARPALAALQGAAAPAPPPRRRSASRSPGTPSATRRSACALDDDGPRPRHRAPRARTSCRSMLGADGLAIVPRGQRLTRHGRRRRDRAAVRILVAGATGYVGSNLLPALLAAGHEVRALSRSGDADRRRRGLPGRRAQRRRARPRRSRASTSPTTSCTRWAATATSPRATARARTRSARPPRTSGASSTSAGSRARTRSPSTCAAATRSPRSCAAHVAQLVYVRAAMVLGSGSESYVIMSQPGRPAAGDDHAALGRHQDPAGGDPRRRRHARRARRLRRTRPTRSSSAAPTS